MRTYCEFVATSTTTIGAISVGLIEYAGSLTTPLGIQSSSFGYYPDGAVKNNNTTAGTGSTWGLNDVIGMIFDDIAGTLQFLKNNTASYTYTGVGAGHWYPAAIIDVNDTLTGHFAVADWTYTPSAVYAWSNYYYDDTPPFDPTLPWDLSNVIGTVTSTDAGAVITSTTGAIAGKVARTTGKYFFNITMGTYPTLDSRMGIMFGENLSLTPGDDANAVVMRFNGTNGEVWSNNSIQAYLYYTNGDPFDVYVDLDAGTAIFYHFAGNSWTHYFTANTPVKPIFAGVQDDACGLVCDPTVLAGNQLDGTKTDYLPWFDGL